jgi:ornithine cyclodeaminase/alanine dehydrogenase-like protein (mu-crystallin family)
MVVHLLLLFVGAVGVRKYSFKSSSCKSSFLLIIPIPMYTMSTHKVAIIGAGAVGSTIAYTLILKNVTTEILLVDVDQAFLEGQVLDLSDTASVSSCKVKKASLKEAGQADIILVTAGAKQKEGESRTSVSTM